MIDAIGFFDAGVKIVVLHRITSPEFDKGDVIELSKDAPKWIDLRNYGNQVFDCLIDGRRVVIDDHIQIFYATDDERSKYCRLDYVDYASHPNVGFLQTNETMWELAVEYASDQLK